MGKLGGPEGGAARAKALTKAFIGQTLKGGLYLPLAVKRGLTFLGEALTANG